MATDSLFFPDLAQEKKEHPKWPARPSRFSSFVDSAMLGALTLVAVQSSSTIRCDQPGGSIMADMHDGDMKKSELSADGLVTITPFNNTQTWMVKAKWDAVHCNASIDFRVHGKPNPPPVPLTMTYYRGEGGSGQSTLFTAVFTDPSGTLAPSSMPLNAWLATDSFPPPRSGYSNHDF